MLFHELMRYVMEPEAINLFIMVGLWAKHSLLWVM